jgi:hypothetical protein
MSLALESSKVSTEARNFTDNKVFPHVSSFVGGNRCVRPGGDRVIVGAGKKNFPQSSNRRRKADESDKGATDVLKTSLLKFFEQKEHIDRLLPIINRTSSISLRLLDYFCVNYSRSTQVVYMIADKYFDVYSSYKIQLRTFSKKRFDPFKRNTRMTYPHESGRFETTIAQLCFFKWCLTNNVLDYVEKNIAAISEDMKKNSGKQPSEHGHSSERKRRSSRKKSSITVAATRVPTPPGTDTIVVSFDD